MSRGLGTGRLFRRQFLADRAAALVVVCVVLVLAPVAAALPRLAEQVFTDDLHAEMAGTPATLRDVTSVAAGPPPMVAGGDVWAPFDAALAAIRDDAPAAVREATGPGRFVVTAPPAPVEVRAAESATELLPTADPYWAETVRVVEGETPAAATEPGPGEPYVVDVMVARASAEELGWAVGDVTTAVRPVGTAALASGLVYRLSGVYEPLDAAAPVWAHHRAALAPEVLDDWDRGRTLTVAAYVDADSWSALAPVVGSSAETRLWYPLDVSSARADVTVPLRDALSRFIAAAPMVVSEEGHRPFSPILTTGSIDVLDRVAQRHDSSQALIAIVAAGPLGVSLAVLALAARLMVERRRSALALIGARGASPLQLRLLMVTEGLLLGLPAAALATVLVGRFVDGVGGTAGVLLPLVVGLAPAVLLPLAARPKGLRAVRRDLGLGRPSRARTLVEGLAVGAAAAACFALNARGLEAGGAGVDPLTAATPLLLALAVSVLVMRLYPRPMATLGRVLGGRRGTVAYLGTARAVRDPVAGFVPMLALVVGMSIAAFSTVVWSTTERGIEQTAWQQVGADVRVSGAPLTEAELAAVGSLPGVDAVAPVVTTGPTLFKVGTIDNRVPLYVVDVDALDAVRAGGSALDPLPAGLTTLGPDGAIPLLVADGVVDEGATGTLSLSERLDAVVAGTVDSIPGLTSGSQWMLADRGVLEDAGVTIIPPRITLVDVTSGGSASAVAAELGERTVTTPGSAIADLRGPVNDGTARAIVGAIALTGLLCAAAVVLTMVVGAPSRGRLLSQLRTLGLSGRQGEGLVVWEAAPVAAVSLVTGLLLGVGLPWAVLSGVDLRSLTGGGEQPAVHLPFGLLGVVTLGFVLVVGVAVVVSVLTGRRLAPARMLRIGDET
ncbi:FtsX-like permease family protein [Jiangella alkaliphila]|uniref:Putative ABC transport system permease protein n=1 Tax=Jiangella alkaliphila TaxID=419479 RepID=A0A1H2KFL5_9ACTN|nr:FtsX-like permease family protein [Jiangella alkaliphila]SDU67372.1 putative ABC transport system permease protein [Jiangella alkaliphila]